MTSSSPGAAGPEAWIRRYILFHCKTRSLVVVLLSASLSIATIWVFLNFDFRMTAPDAEQSTLDC